MPRPETTTIERGTTAHVAGLRLGVMHASDGTGIVAVLSGPGVPQDANWEISGKAWHSTYLTNGYTITIDEVVGPRFVSDGDGSHGASVTVTVIPPPDLERAARHSPERA